uniref:Uncharacterized protein n=1 Tax=Arundo donax TaxID=35708 RepID=A0A0A9BKM7_ARUDO
MFEKLLGLSNRARLVSPKTTKTEWFLPVL